MKSIHHHRQLLCFLCPQASLDGTGMRTMRDPARMQGDHPLCHVLPAHEVTIHIIQQLIAVDIAVVVGGGYCPGMIVEQSWTKRTYYKVMPLESLVHRRRLMYPPGYRLEIMNAEGKWITAAIPADHIERMMPVMNGIDPAPLLRPDQEIPFLILCGQRLRPADIPFTIRENVPATDRKD